jgi:hypothetical protein
MFRSPQLTVCITSVAYPPDNRDLKNITKKAFNDKRGQWRSQDSKKALASN